MTRLPIITLVIGLIALPAWAQTSNATTTDPNTATTFRLSGGTPGSWVEAAIARHKTFINARVNARRSGQTSTQNQSNSGTSATTSTTSGSASDLLSQLSGSLNTLGSFGSLSTLGNLTGLLSGQTGTTTTGSTTTGTTTSSSGMTIADLLALRDALAGQSSSTTTGTTAKSTTSATNNSSTTASNDTTQNLGGALARLPKASQLQTQTTTTAGTGTDQPKFVDRLLTSWATTFFTAISVGFQTTDFISALKKGLEPLFPVLSATNTNSTDPNSNSSDPNSNSTDPNSNSSDPNTGGIENISPPNGNTGDNGSSTL